MTLWKLNDSRMSRMIADWEIFRGWFFSIAPKPPSFLLVPSFLRHFRMLQMSRNEKYNGDISFQCQFTQLDFIRSSFLTQEWCPTDGMRVKWGVFLEASRIPWFWNQFHSTIIPSLRQKFQQSHHHSIHLSVISVIPRGLVFRTGAGNTECLKNVPEWGRNERITCCLFRRDNNRFVHSEDISDHLSLIWQRLNTILLWNDTELTEWLVNGQNEVGMNESGAVS